MERTRPATWEDLKTIARYLQEAGAQYALVGAYALAAHGLSRFSEDIDLLVEPSVMPAVGGLSWEALRPHIMTKDLDGQQFAVLDLEGLLKTKQSLRPKDQMDAQVIAAALEALKKRR